MSASIMKGSNVAEQPLGKPLVLNGSQIVATGALSPATMLELFPRAARTGLVAPDLGAVDGGVCPIAITSEAPSAFPEPIDGDDSLVQLFCTSAPQKISVLGISNE
jgi:hypothetical protein